MKYIAHLLPFLVHKLRFVGAVLACVIGFFYISFYDFEGSVHRVAHLSFSQQNTDDAPQNLFCESTETEEREDDNSEPNGAHFSPIPYLPCVVFCTKKPLAFPPLIACFENEAIEQETPPPDFFKI
jgi:hypothetical protein